MKEGGVEAVRGPGQSVSHLSASQWRGSPVTVIAHRWFHWGWPCSRQGILERSAAWVLTPHLGLLGTLPDLHIVRVCILLGG